MIIIVLHLQSRVAFMKKILKSTQIRTLFPYFLLALAVIAAYHAAGEIRAFASYFLSTLSIVMPFFYGFMLAYILNIPFVRIQILLEHIGNILTRTGSGTTSVRGVPLGEYPVIAATGRFIQRRKKAFSLLSVYLILALLIVLIMNWVVPAIGSSIAYFGVNFQTYYQSALQFIEYVNYLTEGTPLPYIDLDEIMVILQEFFSPEQIFASLMALTELGMVIFRIFLALISSVYILIEKEKFKNFLKRFIRVITSPTANSTFLKYTDQLNLNFKRYLYTQTIDGLILGTLATILLTFLIRSPYALILGIMLGVVNYIPYFGSIFGTIVAVIVVALTQDLTTALLATVVLLILQQIDANIIQPKLMGGSFSVSPLLVIISVTVGGAFAGVIGMIAAIPIVALLKDILEDITTHYESINAQKATRASQD